MVNNPLPGSPRHAGPSSSWAAVLAVALGTFSLVSSEFLPVGLLPAIRAELGVSTGTAGLMITIPGLLAAAAAPLLTIAAGNLDRRTALWGLSALLVASNALAALAPTMAVMLGARVLLGIVVGGFWAIGVSIGARLVPAASVARATALILAGISIGTVLGLPAGTLLGELAGWRTAFATAAALAAAVLVIQLFTLPPLPTRRAVRPGDLLAVFTSRTALVGLGATALIVTGHFAAYTYITPFLTEVGGVHSGSVGALLLAYGVAGLIGNLLASATVTRHLRATLAVTATLLGAAVLNLPGAAASPGALTLLVVLWGLAFGAVPLGLQTWMFRSAGAAGEGGTALFVSVFQLVLALGALLGGLIVNAVDLSAALWSGGGIALATVVAVTMLGRAPEPLPA